MKKRLSHANSHHKTVGVATQVSDKRVFKTKMQHFIMIEGSNYQENNTDKNIPT